MKGLTDGDRRDVKGRKGRLKQQCIPLWFRSGSDLIIEDLYHEFLLLVFVSISQIWEKLNIIFIALYVLDFLLCLFLCFLLCALFYSVTIFACCLLFIESHCGHGALILCTFLILCFGVWLYGVATVLPWRDKKLLIDNVWGYR